MVQSQFSLSWDSYKSNICTGFSSFQQNGELVDLTLAADGYFVKVHKVLLALSSPYLRELISSAPCQHPVIFLNNVSHSTLCLILEYVYTGQVVVPAKNLHSFMETAKSLHIKGLENVDSTNNKSEEKNTLESNYETNISNISGEQRISSYSEEFSLPISAKRISIKHESASNKIERSSRRKSKVMEDNHNMQDCLTFDDTDIHDSDDNQVVDTMEKKDLPVSEKYASTNLQFTVSIRGSLQVILNRYMYNLHSTKASGMRRWRCIEYRNKKCMAFLVTRGTVVLNRANLHCHSFHDKKILGKIEKNAVYSTIQDVEGYKEREKKATSDISVESDDCIISTDFIDDHTCK